MSSLRHVSALFANEILVTASSSTTQRGAVYVLDPAASTQTPLLHWKGTSQAAPHCVSCVASATHAVHGAGTSGLVAVMESDKAVLHLYSWQRDQALARLVLPQKMSCLALSPQATYLAAGGHDGRLYVWEVATGALLCSMEAHYRAISVLRWTEDTGALITASQDARICVWSLPTLMQYTDLAGRAAPSPYVTFSDHSLGITDMHVTSGAFPGAARLWSASDDGTVKLWDLASRRLMTTLQWDEPIWHLAVDPLERFIVVAAKSSVQRVDMYDTTTGHALGGRGSTGVVERMSDTHRVSLSEPVSAIALSHMASHVAVGTAHGVVHIMDVLTLQTVRTLPVAGTTASATPTTPVTSICSLVRPVDLMSTLTLRGAATKRTSARGDTEASASTYIESLPLPTIAPQFARTVVPVMETMHVMLRPVPHVATAHDAPSSDVLHASPQNEGPALSTSTPRSIDTSVYEAEIQALQAQVQRAKTLNDQLWQHLVQTQAGASV